MARNRQTIAREGELCGVGLHTGARVRMRFLPGAAGEGVQFLRTDLPGGPRIPARIEAVDRRQKRRTVLRNGEAEVQTVEHLLASCAGLGLDDLLVEMDGPEVPGGDGSAADFHDLLRNLGARDLDEPCRPWVVRRPVSVSEGDATACAVPSPGPGFRLSYVLQYDNPLLAHQSFAYDSSSDEFLSALGRARTFCLEEEVEILRRMGFGKGASVENTVVVRPDGGVHGPPLRFDDECARHKVLDLLGDLGLAGAPVQGAIYARKTGHAVNHRLVEKIVSVACVEEETALDTRELVRILPHRYPFLLIDRVLVCDPPRRAVGVKNVSADEDFFQGHFPAEPLMPGVLQLEAMAQLAGALLLRSQNYEGRIALILSMEGVRFRKTVRPGDRLVITAEAVKIKSRTAETRVRAAVEGQLCTEARFRFILVDEEPDAA